MHGCNASKMKEISNFALAEIDLDSIQHDRDADEITIPISGHSEHVKHTKYLLNQHN